MIHHDDAPVLNPEESGDVYNDDKEIEILDNEENEDVFEVRQASASHSDIR